MKSKTAGAVLLSLCVLLLTPALAEAQEQPVAQAIFRSGDSSYFCFRIPALVTTKNNVVLAFAEARKTNCADWDEIDLVEKRSTDGGKTWSNLSVLFHLDKASMNQPSPILDRETGAVWFLFCKDNQQVFATKTSDDGMTWTKQQEITAQTKDATWKYVAAGPGHGIQLKSGRLLLAAWGDASPGPVAWPPKWGEIEFTFTIYSDDHGATWQHGRPMYENSTEEAMVVETGDNEVYMALRNLRGHERGSARSTDGGFSWSRIAFDPSLPDPPAHASILRVIKADGNSCLLFVNPASTTSRSHLTARLSDDRGLTWPTARTLYEGSAAYSDLTQLQDGTVLCLFEAEHYTQLALARFPIEWVEKGNGRVK